jgi:quercetin dioxygenase-like cupin family protein
MQVTPSASQTVPGPADWFAGDVLIDSIRSPDGQSAIGASHVRFAPGARTAWHAHPFGQTLYVTDGIGLVCRRGGGPVEIRPGDVVYIEPGEEHWHGATPGRFMAHIAMHEADAAGEAATWLEHVTDEDYLGQAGTQRMLAEVSDAESTLEPPQADDELAAVTERVRVAVEEREAAIEAALPLWRKAHAAGQLNVTETARVAGVTRPTVYTMLRDHQEQA